MAAKYDYLLKKLRLKDGNGSTSTAEALPMTTTERTAITPDAGVLIWDTDLEKLFVGDGSTAGGVEVQGGGGEGTVTGIEASVSGGTATITATGSTTSVKLTGTGGVDVRGNTTTGAVELDVKDLSDGTQSVTKDLQNARFVEANPWGESTSQNALTLVHFSDIHADAAALGRIVADAAALSPNVNDIICTGDMVFQNNGEIASWWNPNVLTVIGNHECRSDSGGSIKQGAISMADRDTLYIAPFEANWGITHTSGTSYYYKDYTTQNVRLIVLDEVLYNTASTATTTAEATAQTTWLEGLLASAITSGLHVLIAAHASYHGATSIACSFSRLNQAPEPVIAGCELPPTVISAVASAIGNGLKFVGYIVGHYHQDGVWDVAGDRSQIAYAVTTACVNPSWQWSYYGDQYRDTTLDAYNIVTVDTINSRLKIVRGGGANVDCLMRKREILSVNYATNEIVDYQTMGGDSTHYKPVINIAGSFVTLRANEGYKITALSNVTLNAETMPSDSWGKTSVLDITITGGTIIAGNNVVMANSLTDDARNICSVNFIDGIAVVSVLSVIGGIPAGAYAVSIATGTEDGSLYYGLATSDKTDIYVKALLNGETLDLANAVTNGAKTVHGNGYTSTTISGGVSCTSDTTFTAMSMNGVSVLGGVAVLDGVNISSGSTVNVSSACIVPRQLVGAGTVNLVSATSASDSNASLLTNGGVAYINGTTVTGGSIRGIYVDSDGSATIESCLFEHFSNTTLDDGAIVANGAVTILGGTYFNNTCTSGYGGVCHVVNGACSASGVLFAGNESLAGGALSIKPGGKTHSYTSCTFVGNSANRGGAVFVSTGVAAFESCHFTSNTAKTDFGGAIAVWGGSATFTSCDFASNTASAYGCVAHVQFDGSLSMDTCVISGNHANNHGLIRADSTGYVQLKDTIVANNLCDDNGNRMQGVSIGSNCSADITGCTIAGNTDSYACLGLGGSGVINISSCVISGNANSSTDIGVTGGHTFNALDGNIVGTVRVNNNGSFTIAGNNLFDKIDTTAGTATVIISGGAEIQLTSSINVGTNRTTVLTGGCVVNGVTIAAGTYTSIVSSGGSAVAS